MSGTGIVDSPTPVNPAISDLFFNTDLSEAKLYDGKGNFIGYAPERMAVEVTTFLDNLRAAGVPAVPSAEALLIDFYGRV